MLEDIPNVDDYTRAFLEVEDGLPPKHLEMLRVNYHAPERTTTATELAAAVGYPSFGSANLQDGALGKRLCLELNRRPKYWVSALVEFTNADYRAGKHLKWTLRPQVARVLEQLDWVHPEDQDNVLGASDFSGGQ